ncbi:flagellin [Marinimicrobium sp. ARAG 43.8]|uniref:flagellin N-terminal helical domain-containing protein n=1 Tax=Marinimicrobium sp. ARAG 43.8 TaxID=3418719 RepID=UPI003CE8E9F9
MSLVINTNVASLNAQRQLLQSGNALDQATERLSSGNRINSAKDDAAGLAIANRMTSQVRGLNQAVRNANDGISMVQTAEGALQEATNILQRMRELSIQAANGSYEDVDRSRLDSEVQLLKVELDRIAKDTTFNGKALLDGSLQNTLLQVGSEQNQTIGLDIGSFSTSSLGGNSGDLVGEESTGLGALQAIETDGNLVINDTDISALDGANTLNEALNIINADLEGKGAEVTTLVQVEGDSGGSGVLRSGDVLTLTLTDGDNNTQEIDIANTNNMEELVEKINSSSSIEASLDTNGRLILSAEGATSIEVAGTGDSLDNTGLEATTTNFSLVINDTSTEKRGVTISGDGTEAVADNLGIDFNDDSGNLLGADLVAAPTLDTLNKGDLIINGVAVGAMNLDGATAAENAEILAEKINDISSETGVVAIVDSDALKLRSSTGDEISIQYGESVDASNMYEATGLQERNAANGVGSVASINISTAAGAQKAIGILDEAIDQVGQTRADLGAINNRLEFTVANLSNISEKTSAARSRIMDADFAAETANLSKSQVLQQAAQAMLAQANARPQQVLQLLQ